MVNRREFVEEIQQTRDELALKVHLASMEVREDWQKLEGQWETFMARAGMDETAEGISSALGQLGSELKQGYQRIRKALAD